MQLPTVLSTPTSNTCRELPSPASGRPWPVWSVQASPPGHQILLRQQMQFCHQGLMSDDATVNHGSARRAVISDSGVRPASRSGTVIVDNKDKKDKASNADRQPGPASDKPASGHRKGFACVVCRQSLPTRVELRQHCDTHHGKAKEFPCPFCDKVFAKSSDLIQHGKCYSSNVRSEEEFRCDLCDRVFCYKQNLRAHQKAHDDGRAQRCDECGVDFVGNTMLVYHRISCHGKGKLYSCTLCDSGLASKGSLKKHYANCHGVVEGAIASSKTNACKDANMHVNTDAECKEVTACSKAEKRKACSESEVESTCSESEKGIICNEHAKETPEDLKDHRHFPGKMTSRWIALFSASQQ